LSDTGEALIEVTQKVNNTLEIVEKLKNDSISKTEKVSTSLLTNDVKSKLFGQAVYLTQQVSSEIFVKGLRESDFVSIHFVNDKERFHLIRNEDYEIVDEDDGILISLSSDWLIENANISIEAIHFGV
jgi:hypothetical protein